MSRLDAVPAPPDPLAPLSDRFSSRSPFGAGLIFAGSSIIVGLIGMLSLWLYLAPIESAVIATGVVAVDTNTKTVQHLEGGIVENIFVREGQHVQAGDILIKLQSTLPSSTLNEVRAQYYGARAAQARLTSERDGLQEIALPDDLNSRMTDPTVRDAILGQKSIFENRRTLIQQRLSIFERTVSGLVIEISGLEGQITSSKTKLSLIDEELVAAQSLLEKGLTNKPRVLALQREKAEIEGAIGSYKASIGVSRQRIEEVLLRSAELKAASATEIVKGLEETTSTAYEMSQKLAAAEDILRRTEIRSPIDGTVVGIKIHTLGGVVTAGQPLLDVVPTNEKLVIQASIDALDIDQVRPGLPANIGLWAINRRSRTAIEGYLQTVSADRFVDPKTGFSYYQARVELSSDSPGLKTVTLQPGMSADVAIRTGSRTPWEYFLAPISRSLSRVLVQE
ncbi:HlyD family type I secretion periplasmic adaptor subunit [Microvirga sp. 2YAF29]|uniref:HlyD family type I secretion periplasmic adaptor subunit n=1 Tax=Microvirga sp. 2YAF29 TaxID=3233031 RepID=UPI003F9CE15F